MGSYRIFQSEDLAPVAPTRGDEVGSSRWRQSVGIIITLLFVRRSVDCKELCHGHAVITFLLW